MTRIDARPLAAFAADFPSTAKAIRAAIATGYRIKKAADPTEGGREGLTADEAIEVAQQDVGRLSLVSSIDPDKVVEERVNARILRLVTGALKSTRPDDLAWLLRNGGNHPVVAIIQTGRDRNDSEEAIVRAIRALDPKFADPYYDTRPAQIAAINDARYAEAGEAREMALLRLVDAKSARFAADLRAFLALGGNAAVVDHIRQLATYRGGPRDEIAEAARAHLSQVAPGLLAA